MRTLNQLPVRPRPVRLFRLLLCSWLWWAAAAEAQEALRMSLASSQAAEARRQALGALGYYNLKLGPTAWNFGAALGLEASDNIRLEPVDPKEDLLFRPEIRTRMLWPITDKNSLNLSLGVGYSAYVQHSEFDRFFITPGSELSFDVYAGDFLINLHDRFSILQDSYQDPTVVGVADYSRLENDLGISALWDLNKLVARFGYDYVNYSNLQGGAGAAPDGQSELIYTSAGYALGQGLVVGMELGGGLIHYSGAGTNTVFTEATQWSVGAFNETQLSQYLRFRAAVGFTMFSPDAGGRMAGDFTGVYAQVALNHRLNQYVDYTLTGGRNVSFTFYGGTIDLTTVSLAANWHLLWKMSLGTSFTYEHGLYLYSLGETFDRFGPGLTLGRALTKKLSATAGYQFYWRGSNLPDRDYSVNLLSLSLLYQF